MASEVQSLLFPRSRFSAGEAQDWAASHDFISDDVHTTARYHRLRQYDPSPGERYRTITFGRGIKAVVGFPGSPDELAEVVEAAHEVTGGRQFRLIG